MIGSNRDYISHIIFSKSDLFKSPHSNNRFGILGNIYKRLCCSYGIAVNSSSNHSHFFLIGWNLDRFRCCISAAVGVNSEESIVDQYNRLKLALNRSNADLRYLLRSCSKDGAVVPMILGEYITSVPSDYIPPIERQQDSIWIVLTADSLPNNRTVNQFLLPKLHSLYALGCQYSTSCYLFQYETVNTDRLVCLRRESDIISLYDNDKSTPQESYFVNNDGENKPSTIEKSELDLIVSQINSAHELKKTILFHLDSFHEQNNNNSVYESYRFSRALGTVYNIIINAVRWLHNSMINAVFSIAWLWFIGARIVRHRFDQKYSFFTLGIGLAYWLGLYGGRNSIESVSSNTVRNGGISCNNISLTSAYITERLIRFESSIRKCAIFPVAWSLPPNLKQNIYIEVTNFVMFVIIDIILGCFLGIFLIRNSDRIVQIVESLCFNLQKSFILDTLVWFNNSPGGVKLNPVITSKVGSLVAFIVNSYDIVLLFAKIVHKPLIIFIAYSGCFGFTVQLVMIIDAIRLLTLHVAAIHRGLSYLHENQIRLIYSLWLLFNGKKRNILRNRIDTCEYDQNELLMGTMLFAMTVFLFPSFAAYFYLFAFCQLGIVFVHYILWATVVGTKEFPYYMLTLFLYDYKYVTNGVQFEVIPHRSYNTSAHHNENGIPQSQPSNLDKKIENMRSQGNKISIKKEILNNVKGILKSSGSHNLTLPNRTTSSKSIASIIINNNPQVRFSDEILINSNKSNKDNSNSPMLSLESAATVSSDSDSHSLSVSSEEIIEGLDKIRTEENDHKKNQNQDSNNNDKRKEENHALHSGLHLLNPALNLTNHFTEDPSNSHIANILNEYFHGSPDSNNNASPMINSKTSFRSYYDCSILDNYQINDKNDKLEISNQILQARLMSSSTNPPIYIELLPRIASITSLFSGYLIYISYIYSEKGTVGRLLRGIFFGRPALDIQLIHVTSELAQKRSVIEQRRIQEAFLQASDTSISIPEYPRNAKDELFDSIIHKNFMSTLTFWQIVNMIKAPELYQTVSPEIINHKNKSNNYDKNNEEEIIENESAPLLLPSKYNNKVDSAYVDINNNSSFIHYNQIQQKYSQRLLRDNHQHQYGSNALGYILLLIPTVFLSWPAMTMTNDDYANNSNNNNNNNNNSNRTLLDGVSSHLKLVSKSNGSFEEHIS
eukprot:gene6662-9144_t